jgi:hypothetical protein
VGKLEVEGGRHPKIGIKTDLQQIFIELPPNSKDLLATNSHSIAPKSTF